MSDDEYVQWMQVYKDWYESSVNKWHALLISSRIITLIATISAGVGSIFLSGANVGYLKWLIALLSLIGAAANQFIAEFQIIKMEGLREQGRVETQHLAIYARDKLEQFPPGSAERFKIKDEIRTRLRDLEETQGKEFSKIQGGEGAHRPEH